MGGWEGDGGILSFSSEGKKEHPLPWDKVGRTQSSDSLKEMNPWIHKSKSKNQSDFGRDQVTQENHDFPLERKAPKENVSIYVVWFFLPLQLSEEGEIVDLLLMKILSFLGVKCKRQEPENCSEQPKLLSEAQSPQPAQAALQV